ncbi:MAG: LPS export ABC transporter periplasmic protein LptC [Saezia sp.]
MRNLLDKFFEALILSIPLLVMGLLAVGTWWLVLITPEISSVVKSRVLRDTPDLIVNDFMLERFDSSGALRSSLTADVARRFPAINEITMDQVDLMTTESTQSSEVAQPVLGSTGINFFKVTAIADRSILHNDQSMIELLDNAYVTRQPYGMQGDREKTEFLGDELKVLLREGKLYSDKPVDISQDGTRFTANAMTYDYATNTLQMTGRVVGDAVQTIR